MAINTKSFLKTIKQGVEATTPVGAYKLIKNRVKAFGSESKAQGNLVQLAGRYGLKPGTPNFGNAMKEAMDAADKGNMIKVRDIFSSYGKKRSIKKTIKTKFTPKTAIA